MREKTEKNPLGSGKPAAKIDWDAVAEMGQAGCTIKETAAAMGVTSQTLSLNYKKYRKDLYAGEYETLAEYFQAQRSGGDALIKVKQFKKAVKGDNDRMLIWLGKNRLGQSDKREIKADVSAVTVNKLDLNKLTDEELENLEQILTRHSVEDDDKRD